MSINLQEIYTKCATELDHSGFRSHIIDDITTQKRVFRAVGTPQPTRALCLGLGSFSCDGGQAYTSSVQLYAFKSMLGSFDIPESKAIVHDPAFSDIDRHFIEGFGMSTQADPEAALQELICEEPTLIFHPCLPWPVLEIVLRQNWSPSLLQNVIFFGNRLDGWVNDHFIKRIFAKKNLSDYVTKYYTTRLDRCIPLFDTKALTRRDYVDREGLGHPQDSVPISESASFVSEFCFQWIPTYRVFATGEQFWRILKLEESKWRASAEAQDEAKAEERPVKSKL